MKKFLKRSGILDSLRDTPIFTLYCKIWHRQTAISFDKLCEFYRKLVRDYQIPLAVWFDVGANIGNKSVVFSKFAERVVSLEPDPTNVLSLRRRFRSKRNITILETAVGASSGKATMTVGWGAFSTLATKQREINEKNLGNAEVQNMEVGVVSLDELIGQYGLPGYIKVDVEGYEETVLKGLSQKVPMISLEANLPDFVKETAGCIELLSRLSPDAKFNFVSTEPPENFSSKSWLTPQEMLDVVKSGSYQYMEIFARLV